MCVRSGKTFSTKLENERYVFYLLLNERKKMKTNFERMHEIEMRIKPIVCNKKDSQMFFNRRLRACCVTMSNILWQFCYHYVKKENDQHLSKFFFFLFAYGATFVRLN